ncbi:MAG: twin-arginine translocation signal domain-containing protein [Rhizobiaceae bacterium]
MNKGEDKGSVEARRSFLKLAGAGTVLGGAAIAVGGNAQAEEVLETEGAGYRETAHVKKYYELTRF